MKSMRNKDGISKAETVLVIAVIAIIVAVLIVGYMGSIKRARVNECAVRRSSIEHSFKALYAEEATLRKCKTKSEILQVTGPDVIQYMIDKDAYTGPKTCVSCEIPYSFKFQYNENTGKQESISYTIKFICPCTKGFDGIEAVIEYCKGKNQN